MVTDYTRKFQSNWTNSGVAYYEGTKTYKLSKVIISQYIRMEQEIQAIYDAQHIRSASGKSLDLLAEMVDLKRLDGEDDDSYRLRIQTQYRIHFSTGTFDEIAEFMLSLVNTSAENIVFTRNFDVDPGAITVSAREDVWNSALLDKAIIADFVEQTVSAGHRIILEQEGSFVLIEDGDTVNDPATGLTSDADLTAGGTLSADL